MKRFLIPALLLAVPAFASQAHEYTLGDLVIDHPMAFETAPMARAGGGYLTVTNNGDTADALVDVRADYPRVEIHESVEKDGVARMQHVERIEIPAGKTVELAPGGYHVMFMGLDDDNRFVEGTKVPATLIFETAGEVEVEFSIEARTGGGQVHDGHGGHGNGEGMQHGKN
ncbi:copper chaperone PCu(A)C [Halovulum sp. GXIMD14794]